MKRPMMVLLVMIAVLALSSPAMVACQTEESATTADATTTQKEEDTTNQEDATTTSSSRVESETFTTLSGWGDNSFGQLGDGIPLPYGDPSTMPVEVSDLQGAELKAFAGGQNHSLALKEDGTILAWGLNQDGQLGDGTNTDTSTPVQVKDPNDPSGYLTATTAIAAGGAHSLALRSDGTVWAWGANESGELGNGVNANSSAPVRVGDLDEVKAIAAGTSYSLALKNDGTIWAWGDNTSSQGSEIGGQLGDDEITSSNTPVQVSELPGGAVEAIAAGASHGLALKEDGTVWAWGFNFFGQLGNGTTTDSSTPVRVSDLDEVTAIAAGGAHSLALESEGTVWAWGSNQFGQLGNGTRTISPTNGVNTPVRVNDLSGVKAIAAGGEHSLAGW